MATVQRRLYCTLTAMMLLCLVMLFAVSPAHSNTTPTQSPALATDADGYMIITTPAELEVVRGNLAGKYRLYADIDLKSYVSNTNTIDRGWYPIGYGAPYFTGVFDGNGHTISGLWSSGSYGICYKGLFSVIRGATVKNLNIVLDTRGITGGYEVGGITGDARDGSVIDNCTVKGGQIDVTAGGYAGGIVGFSYGTLPVIIRNCTVTDTYTKTSGNYSGGLIGVADGRTQISQCRTINTTSNAYSYAGGLAGAVKGQSTVTDCCAGGAANTVASYCGGLAGAVYEGSSIIRSGASGNVTADFYGGGLVATLYDSSSLSQCRATGNVTVKNYIAGGLVGEAVACTISNCYAQGNVKGTTGTGGLVGYFSGAGSNNNKYVENSYSSGAVTGIGTTEYGAFNGRSGVKYMGTNYYDAAKALVAQGYGTAGPPIGDQSAYPQGKSTADMMKKSTFVGWNFSSIWKINEGSSYPYFDINCKGPDQDQIPLPNQENPKVNSGDAKDVTDNSVKIDDNTYTDVKCTVISVGVQYSTNSTMTTGVTTVPGTIGSPFSVNLTGLQPDTTYYYRAVLVTSCGTYYGNIKSVKTAATPPTPEPTVNSGDAKDTTDKSATIDNNTYSDMTCAVNKVGVQYGVKADLSDATSVFGTVGSPFSVNLTGLQANTTYYYRAVVNTACGTFYGNIKSFKTAAPAPAVNSGNPTNLTANGATIADNTYTGMTCTVNKVGVQYGLNADLSGAASAFGTVGSPFSVNLTGLQANTTYYYRAVVNTACGTFYGAIKSFKTPAGGGGNIIVCIPSVKTGDANPVQSTTATIVNNSYDATAAAIAVIREVGDQISLNADMSGGTFVPAGSITTPFSVNLTGLQPNTTYYYRAYVLDGNGNWHVGEIKSFKTTTGGGNIIVCPYVTTGDPNNVQPNTAAIVNNSYVAASIPGVSQVGDQVSLNGDMSLGTFIPAGSVTTPFSVNLTGLQPGTTYYYRAYVIDANGNWRVGQIKQFTTPSAAGNVTVTYNPNGGTGQPVVENVPAGIYVIKNPGYTRDGMVISGWNTKPDGTGVSYATGDQVNLGSSVTLYAQWCKACELVTVITGTINQISATKVSVNGNTYSGNTGAVSSVGVQYSTDPAMATGVLTCAGTTTTSPFNSGQITVASGHAYYFRAVVVCASGTFYGNISSAWI